MRKGSESLSNNTDVVSSLTTRDGKKKHSQAFINSSRQIFDVELRYKKSRELVAKETRQDLFLGKPGENESIL